jgi:hypothetical protein
MVNVVTTKVNPQEKMEWLKIWNGDQIIWDQNFFPPRPIYGPTLNPWLNRRTFWWDLHFPMYLHLFVFYTTCQYAWMNVFSIVNTLLTHGSLVAPQGCGSLICSLHHSMEAFPFWFGRKT